MTQDNLALRKGLPHVAYVVLWYPLFTQPFIFREVECLRQVLPLEVYTLYGKNLRCCSREMKQAPAAKTHGIKCIPAILATLAANLVGNPRKLWRLFKDSCVYRWTSLETFGENLWAFCVGVKLAKDFKEGGIDFVYAPWPRGAATAARVAASLAKLPFATAARGDNLAPADPDFASKLAAAAFIRANNRADQGRIEKFANGIAAHKTYLVYNSITLPRPLPSPPARLAQKPFKLLALGRFDVTKGFDALISACYLLKERRLDFRLTLAGSGGKMMGLGDMEKTLKNLRKSLGLEREIDMPGLVSHDELPKIMFEHDIFVAPCVIHKSGRRDGIPNTVIEAMACGLPVVSTNVNALPEIVREGETGLVVEPNDPAALADAIVRLCEHPEEARSMGQRGATLAAEMFDPPDNARRLADIIINAHKAWKCCKGGDNSCVE